jgi:hypothetical protein
VADARNGDRLGDAGKEDERQRLWLYPCGCYQWKSRHAVAQVIRRLERSKAAVNADSVFYCRLHNPPQGRRGRGRTETKGKAPEVGRGGRASNYARSAWHQLLSLSPLYGSYTVVTEPAPVPGQSPYDFGFYDVGWRVHCAVLS